MITTVQPLGWSVLAKALTFVQFVRSLKRTAMKYQKFLFSLPLALALN
jgi:hypothetical protein